tara:strand:- start:2345 stop:3268 length:924 start_codon:yes stop_codon:yes gene_type:complete
MNYIEPINQTKLFGLDKYMNELIQLDQKNNFPNKLLISGYKGTGKSTLAHHYINYVLSKNQNFHYNKESFEINPENHAYKITLNQTNPNFNIIDLNQDKKKIDINQIRSMISNLSKSSFNDKPRFILIDNIEFLNVNSVNALLKIIEEPPNNTFFILINNNKKILATLKSRCVNYKIILSNKESMFIAGCLLNKNITDLINPSLIDYYMTPGKIYNLMRFSEDFSIDLKDINLKDFLSLIIDKAYYKKETSIKHLIYDFLEFYLTNKTFFKNFNFSNYFKKRIENVKNFNLDEESLFIEFKHKVLND